MIESQINSKDTTDEQRRHLSQVEKITRLFDGALAKHGIKEVDFLPSGFKFHYKDQSIEIKILIK